MTISYKPFIHYHNLLQTIHALSAQHSAQPLPNARQRYQGTLSAFDNNLHKERWKIMTKFIIFSLSP